MTLEKLKQTRTTLEEQHRIAVVNVHRIEGAIAILNEQIAEEEKEGQQSGPERPRLVTSV